MEKKGEEQFDPQLENKDQDPPEHMAGICSGSLKAIGCSGAAQMVERSRFLRGLGGCLHVIWKGLLPSPTVTCIINLFCLRSKG